MGLNDVRRWTNISRRNQSVLDKQQGQYLMVIPHAYVEGGKFAAQLQHNPYFRESLSHLTDDMLERMLPEETDKTLLLELANVERISKTPRSGVIHLLESRVKQLLVEAKEAAHAI